MNGPIGLPSYAGHVPMWELDANAHWNTQFYMRSFEQAAERCGAGAGGVRHVRFFRELRALDTMRIESFALDEGPYGTAHLMRDATTGQLCASALDVATGTLSLPRLPAEMVERIQPRDLPAGPMAAIDGASWLAQGRVVQSHLGVIRAEDFDAVGAVLTSAIHARMSNGIGHLWLSIGITGDDFYANGIGRANVEATYSLYHDPRPGDPVRLLSWFGEVGEKSVRLNHQLETLRDRKVIAVVASVTLVLDLTTRRAAPVPERLRRAFRRRL